MSRTSATSNSTYMRVYRGRATRQPTTRDRILALLMQHGAMTVREIVTALGETYYPVNVFYHLSRLTQKGAVIKELQHRGRTRHSNRYRYRMAARQEHA